MCALYLPKMCGGQELSFAAVLEVGSLIFRVLCTFILGVAIWNLVMGGGYYFQELSTQPEDTPRDWRASIAGDNLCYLFQQKGESDGLDSSYSAPLYFFSYYSPEPILGPPTEPEYTVVDQGDGPCDGAFTSHDDFEEYMQQSRSFCDRASGMTSWCAVGPDFKTTCLLASVTYVLLLTLKTILFLLQVNKRDWADEADWLVTKGLIKSCEFWLVSYAPGVVLAPVTSAISHSSIDAVESTVNRIHWNLTIVLSFLFGVYFLCMTLLGSLIDCCRRCCAKDASTAEDDKKNAKCSRTCGWVLALFFPILGMVVQLFYELALSDFPTLNFPVVFSFAAPDFAVGFIIDIAQLFQFVAFCIDLLVVAVRSRDVLLAVTQALLKMAGKDDNGDNTDNTSQSAGEDGLAVEGGREFANMAGEKAAEKAKNSVTSKDASEEKESDQHVGA